MNVLRCGPFVPNVQWARRDFSSKEQAKEGRSDAFVSSDSGERVKPFRRRFSGATVLCRPETGQRARGCSATHLQDGVILQAHTAPKPLHTSHGATFFIFRSAFVTFSTPRMTMHVRQCSERQPFPTCICWGAYTHCRGQAHQTPESPLGSQAS